MKNALFDVVYIAIAKTSKSAFFIWPSFTHVLPYAVTAHAGLCFTFLDMSLSAVLIYDFVNTCSTNTLKKKMHALYK